MVKETVFDDVFKTLLERCRKLILPVINEVFDTDYDMKEEVILWSNELVRTDADKKNRKRITDSLIQIRDKTYHLECQSNPDKEMAIRMIEYDFRIAADRLEQTEQGELTLRFPRSAVIYLRHSDDMPDYLQIRLLFPDETEAFYRAPVVKLQNYNKEAIFDKKLLFFVPYYIMNFEDDLELIAGDRVRLKRFTEDYEDIFGRLQEMQKKNIIDVQYLHMLVDLTIHLMSYVSKGNEQIEEVVHMGGKVLRLEYDDIIEQGIEQGIERVALSLYDRGMPEDFIMQVTELDEDKLAEILKRNNRSEETASPVRRR